ncbi:MAG TPA: PPOX class F420-dependent oxidoreductase, partial [Candidatus Dormibacteraeota bacterium]
MPGFESQLPSADLPALPPAGGSGRLAHLATINADGSPQVTLVWIGLDGDEIVSGHLRDHLKLRNVRRDPRAVVSVESGGRTNGLDHYLVIRGTARVTE